MLCLCLCFHYWYCLFVWIALRSWAASSARCFACSIGRVKGRPWHFWGDRSRLTGVPQKVPLSKRMKLAAIPLVLTPICPSPSLLERPAEQHLGLVQRQFIFVKAVYIMNYYYYYYYNYYCYYCLITYYCLLLLVCLLPGAAPASGRGAAPRSARGPPCSY